MDQANQLMKHFAKNCLVIRMQFESMGTLCVLVSRKVEPLLTPKNFNVLVCRSWRTWSKLCAVSAKW